VTVTCPPLVRFGVYVRDGGGPWRLLIHAGDRAAAVGLMARLAAEDRGRRDWAVRPVPMPGRVEIGPCSSTGAR
jgi:hypothetical protein